MKAKAIYVSRDDGELKISLFDVAGPVEQKAQEIIITQTQALSLIEDLALLVKMQLHSEAIKRSQQEREERRLRVFMDCRDCTPETGHLSVEGCVFQGGG